MTLNDSGEALRIFLLGGFRLALGSRTILEDAWPRRKARSLVKLLALAPGHRLLREQIMDALWPDQDPQAAANNLHQALYHARRILDPARPPFFLRLQGELVSLAPDQALWIDAEAFEAAAAAALRSKEPALYQDALEQYTGDLLPEDRYEDWAATRREYLRRVYHDVLYALARLQQARGASLLGIKALEQLVASDPLAETAQRDLMRMYARSSRRYQALRQYQQFRSALQRDLGVEPEAETQQLYQEIVQGRYTVDEMSQPALISETNATGQPGEHPDWFYREARGQFRICHSDGDGSHQSAQIVYSFYWSPT